MYTPEIACQRDDFNTPLDFGLQNFQTKPDQQFFSIDTGDLGFFLVRLFGAAQSEPPNKLGGFPELV